MRLLARIMRRLARKTPPAARAGQAGPPRPSGASQPYTPIPYPAYSAACPPESGIPSDRPYTDIDSGHDAWADDRTALNEQALDDMQEKW